MNAKNALKIQIAIMYLVQIPFYLTLIFCQIPAIDIDVIGKLIITGVLLNVLMIPVLIISVVVACKGIVSEDISAKYTLKAKLLLIPWYCFNLVVCLILVAGFLFPFTIIAVPIIVAIEVFVTYLYMLSTSIHSFVRVVKKVMTNEIKSTPSVVIGAILLFIFTLDIVGAYLINKRLSD